MFNLPDQASEGMHVITLGTAAGPAIRSENPGIATAVVVNGSCYLIDFGLGMTRAAHSAGLRGASLRAGFITHLHSDHVAELPAYLLWNWGQPVQGFTSPISIVGPGSPNRGDVGVDAVLGSAAMVRKLLDAFAYDIAIRVADEGRPDLRALVEARDIVLPAAVAAEADGHSTPAMDPFEVYRDENVTVTAILVEHPPVFPAVAYRFDSAYGSVVLSGDTAECENLVTLAAGAELLIHEAVYLDYYEQQNFSAEFLNHQRISHTPSAGAGRVARAAGVGSLVLSHLAGVATEEQWARGAAAEFGGPVAVARPGQRFDVVRATALV